MFNYLMRKILGLVLVMFFASLLTFTLIQLSPGDPAMMFLTAKGTVPTEEQLERTREEMGLNDSMVTQYAKWITGVFRGDLGESFQTGEPVSEIIPRRLVMTARLAVTAFGLLVVFSVLFGTVSAATKDKWPDFLIRILSMIEISIPNFWLGMILIYLFIIKHHVFSLTDTSSFRSIILPSATLAIPMVGRYTRLIRGAVLEEVKSDYVIGAVARGVGQLKIWTSYVLPNAIKKLITLFGMSAAFLLGGTVIIESTFAWPGIGSMAIEAITFRDYPVLQSYVLLMALVFVTFTLFADFLTHTIDPRLRGGNTDES